MRPVTYPPTAEAIHCITMSQIAVMIETVAADAPAFGHAEIEAKPCPVPNALSSSDTAAATAPPAMMAAQDTAETGDSFAPTDSSGTAAADSTTMECHFSAR